MKHGSQPGIPETSNALAAPDPRRHPAAPGCPRGVRLSNRPWPAVWLLPRMLRLLPFVLCLAAGAGAMRPASAHPMGNFTISHYSELTVAPGELRLHHVLDLAEIPTVQERQLMDLGSDGRVSAAEIRAYLMRVRRTLPGKLSLRVNGAAATWTVRAADLDFPPGAANLPTLKLHLRLTAPLPRTAGRIALEYADTSYPARTGWKEVVIDAAPGVRLVATNAPATSLTNALAVYPTDLLNAPPQQTEARVVFVLSAASTATAATAAPPGSADTPAGQGPASKRFANRFTELLTAKRLSWPILLVSLFIAFGLGAAHALEPGHGKTVVAAYLVGSRGTPRHAVWLGLIVTVSHTLGVFALGFVTLFASAYVVPDRLYPWLGAFSGLAITAVGLTLLWRHTRHAVIHALNLPYDHGHAHDLGAGMLGHSRSHGHDHHDHGHSPHHRGHSHSHPDHGRSHVRIDETDSHTHDHRPSPLHSHSHHHDYDEVLTDKGVKFGSLLALGISGGIVPCPGALVVLLSAIALHRVGFGLALILAFSMGLAAVLIGIGLLMVSARGCLARFPAFGDSRWSERLAMVSAAVVSVLGIGITVQALASAGVVRLPL
jgi:nickel/cobalt transporter (NicO) family protein